MNDIVILFAQKGAPSSEDVFEDSFEGMFDLIKDVKLGVRCFWKHRE